MINSSQSTDPSTPTWQPVVEAAIERDWSRAGGDVLDRARLIVADSVCAMLAGGRTEQVQALAAEIGGAGPSVALVPGLPRLAPDQAAFVNGTAGTWLDVDDAADAGVHAGVHVLAAVLAVAQCRPVAGQSLLRAFLAGYEATAGLYRLYPTPYPVHPHAGLTAVGAAAAAALLADAEPHEAARIAATLPMTVTWDACFEGATARHAFAGTSAATAVRSVQLARAGFTGSRTAVDTLFSILTRDRPREGRENESEVVSAEVLRNTFKFNGACLTAHAAVDAARGLSSPPIHDIEGVLVETTETVVEKTARQPRPNDLSAGFSVQYAVAAALRWGDGLVAIRYDPETAELARRVEVRIGEGFPSGEHDIHARVTLRRRDGSVETSFAAHPRGHFGDPPGVDELRAKAIAILGSPAPFDVAMSIPELSDVRELSGL